MARIAIFSYSNEKHLVLFRVNCLNILRILLKHFKGSTRANVEVQKIV
jgi:hypothetical protein